MAKLTPNNNPAWHEVSLKQLTGFTLRLSVAVLPAIAVVVSAYAASLLIMSYLVRLFF